MNNNLETYKNQMEVLYKQQYDKELKFDEVEKRDKFLVGITKKKEMHPEDSRHEAHKVSSATYFVVPIKKDNLGNEGVLMQIESAPAHTGYYYDRDGQNDIHIQSSISLVIKSEKSVLAKVDSRISDDFDIDARDNAKISAWLKHEYSNESCFSYSVESDISVPKVADLSWKEKQKMKEKTLKFAQDFMKKFACNGDEFVREGKRLKRVEKIGTLREKVTDKWKKEAAQKAQQKAQNEKKTAREKVLKEVSGQQDIMNRYMQKSFKERILDWFK